MLLRGRDGTDDGGARVTTQRRFEEAGQFAFASGQRCVANARAILPVLVQVVSSQIMFHMQRALLITTAAFPHPVARDTNMSVDGTLWRHRRAREPLSPATANSC